MSTTQGIARELIRLTGCEEAVRRGNSSSDPRVDRLPGGPHRSGGTERIGQVHSASHSRAGSLPIQEGEIWWADDLQQEALGYVPQGGGLYGELSVRDNLDLRRRLYGLPPTDQAATPFMAGLGLAPSWKSPSPSCREGSSGWRSWLPPLESNPTWLFLDEPFAGVDEAKAKRSPEAVQRLEIASDPGHHRAGRGFRAGGEPGDRGCGRPPPREGWRWGMKSRLVTWLKGHMRVFRQDLIQLLEGFHGLVLVFVLPTLLLGLVGQLSVQAPPFQIRISGTPRRG